MIGSYKYPRPILFKIEKIVGFIVFILGIFSILKLLNVLSEDFIVPSQYMAWFMAICLLFFGFLLMNNKQHGVY